MFWLCSAVYPRDQLSHSGNISNLETSGFVVTYAVQKFLLP